jgi:SAM-dependent methyltransferase
MDLREHKGHLMKHPWEIARVQALKLLLKSLLEKELMVLDIGCGDGYVCRELFKNTAIKNITALDIHLSDKQIRLFSEQGKNVRYLNDYAKISTTAYDLILLLDVLEHISDDKLFLRDITEKNLAAGGHVFITAPMFQALFASHDIVLGHYRRYSLAELAALADAGGLTCISTGYLFSSLLFARFLSTCLQKVLKRDFASRGAGNSNHRSFVTKVIASLLMLDNRMSLLLNRVDIKLPGLTGWVLCKKQQS